MTDSFTIADNDKMFAGINFLRRTGATQVQVRYSDEEDPTIWICVAKYDGKNAYGIEGVETDASLSPVSAVLRLCERLADGGMCTHCERPVAFETESIGAMPFPEQLCWYQYDPELKVFRRSCEGDEKPDHV